MHGNLGCLGPGFGSMPLSRSKMSCCVLLSLVILDFVFVIYLCCLLFFLSSNKFVLLTILGC